MSRSQVHANSRAHRIGWAICGALLLHAVVLSPWTPARQAKPASHGAMSLRLIPGTTLASVTNTPPVGAPRRATTPDIPNALRQRPAEPHPETLAPVTATTPLSPSAFDPADYLPRSEVSSPPLPLDVIEVPPPPDTEWAGEVHVMLRLYIDESGEVRHIEAVGDRVPGAFEDAARAAFRRARFAPADLLGQVVKSRITVQIDFEAMDSALQPRPQATGSPAAPSA